MKPDLEAIRARAEKATAGPWYVENWGDDGRPHWVVARHQKEVLDRGQSSIWPGGIEKCPILGYDEDRKSDLNFAAHAREDIPALLAYIDSLERVREAAAKGHTDDDGIICEQYPQSRFPCRMCAALAAVGEK